MITSLFCFALMFRHFLNIVLCFQVDLYLFAGRIIKYISFGAGVGETLFLSIAFLVVRFQSNILRNRSVRFYIICSYCLFRMCVVHIGFFFVSDIL